MQIAFLHIGESNLEPTLLVKSVLKTNPNSRIMQITDHATDKIDGVNEVIKIDIDPKNIMEFKVYGFSLVDCKMPTYFLDTDMLTVGRLPVLTRNGFLKRNFDLNVEFNPYFRGLNFHEHEYKTLDQVYPYLSCTTFAINVNPFREMIKIFESLDFKYYRWYGDQEALRIYLSNENLKFKTLHEREYACIPQFYKHGKCKIIHFKGSDKSQMALYAKKYLEIFK